MNLKPLALSTTLAAAAVLAIGGLFWAQLPPNLAVHFSIDGAPNGWMPKSEYLAAMTLIALAVPASYLTAFVVAGALRQPPFAKAILWTVLGVEFEFLVLHAMILIQNIDSHIVIGGVTWAVLIVVMLATHAYAAHLLFKLNRTFKRRLD